MAYVLDSQDPEKLKSIVDDMQQRAKEPIAKLLPSTLVVGEFEKLALLYDKFGIDRAANFISVEESRRGLLALALAGRDLAEWGSGSVLTEGEIADARKLAAFLHAQAEAGRDKVTAFLPRSWRAADRWTKTTIEASAPIRIVTGEGFNGRIYRKPKDPKQDRVFLAMQQRGEAHPDGEGITLLRGAGYPLAVVTFGAKASFSHYMEFVRAVLFGMKTLKPSVEISEDVAVEIPEPGKAWKALKLLRPETPESLARAIRASDPDYGEIVFFGDMRYSADGRAMRKVMETAAQRIFRVKLKAPADIGEWPEAAIDARRFSILLVSREQARFTTAGFEPDAHIMQILAAKSRLEQRRRAVRAILVNDLSSESLEGLEEFFTETAALL
jgi:hypothetical protein